MPKETVIGYPPIISPNGNGHRNGHHPEEGVLIADPNAGEKVKEAIRYHAEQDTTWKYHDIAKQLYGWTDRFRERFLDPIARLDRGKLPGPLIGFKVHRVNVLAYYRLGKNDFGIDDEVILNELYLDRPLYSILETVLHEQIHLWQQRFGEHPIKKNYHNKEFIEKAESFGLHPAIASDGDAGGYHTRPADGLFEALLKEYGIVKPDEAKDVEPGIKIDWWSVGKDLPKGRSTLDPFVCPECGFKARVGKKVDDSPIACVPCTRKKYGDIPLVTFVKQE